MEQALGIRRDKIFDRHQPAVDRKKVDWLADVSVEDKWHKYSLQIQISLLRIAWK